MKIGPLARPRLGEGVAAIARFHELIADHLPESDGPGQVMIGIETGRARGWPRWWPAVTGCIRSTRGGCPGTGSGILSKVTGAFSEQMRKGFWGSSPRH
jgi:hypothetical protein